MNDPTRYYNQLGSDSLKLKERLKDQSKAVQFIIDKQKKIKETFDRLKKETEDQNQKMMIHQNTYSYKNFGGQIKYDFQQMESKFSEFEDFHKEIIQIQDQFAMAATSEQQKSQQINFEASQMSELLQNALKEPISPQKIRQINNQSLPEELLPQNGRNSSNRNSINSSPIKESSQIRGQELQAAALKLQQTLQTYIIQIETIISEQKRTYNISHSRQEFKQLNQDLLSLISDFQNRQDKQNTDQLKSLYSNATIYCKVIEAEIRQYLDQQNIFIDELRISITGIVKLIHVEDKIKEMVPSFDAYLESLFSLLQSIGNDISQNLPEPQQCNEPLLQYLKTLRGQFKLSVINAENNKYFNNLRNKMQYMDINQYFQRQNRAQQKIQKVKEFAERQNAQALEIHQFLIESLELQQKSQLLADQVQKLHLQQMKKLTKEGVQQMIQSFKMVETYINQIQERQLKIQKQLAQNQNQYLKNLLDFLNLKNLDPTLLRLTKVSQFTQEYDQLGDINALIRLSEISEDLAEKRPQIIGDLQKFVQKSEQYIKTNNEPNILHENVLELQKNFIQLYTSSIESLKTHVLNKNIQERRKLQCQQLIQEYGQITKIVEGFQTLIGALQYLSVGNLQNLSYEIQITDNKQITPIDQMRELIIEQVRRIGDQIQKNYYQPWLMYRADEYENLIISEEPGYIWIHEILRNLDEFKNNWKRLFHQEQIASTGRQDEWQPLFYQRMKVITSNQPFVPQQFTNSLAQFFNQDEDLQDSSRINLQIQLNELIALQKNGFQLNIYDSLYNFKPESIRWDYYFSLLHRQSSQIFFKVYYSTSFIQYIQTHYSGLLLSGSENGKKKAEELFQWIRSCSIYVIQTFKEIFQGVVLTKNNLEETIKFTVILHQLHDKIKQILEARKQKVKQQNQRMNMDMIPHSESQYDTNLKDIDDYLNQFKLKISDYISNLENISDGMIDFNTRYAQLPISPELIHINRQIPLALIFLSNIFQGKLKDFLVGLTHIYIHAAWIQEFLSKNQQIDLADPQSFELIYKINRIILYTPLLPLKVNDALQDIISPNGLSKFVVGQMKCLQKQFEDIILSDIQKQQFQELYRQSIVINSYKDVEYICKGVISSLNIALSIYVPQQRESNNNLITYFPKSFLEFIFIKIKRIYDISWDLFNIIQNYQDQKYGCFYIKVSTFKQKQNEIIRWGLISSRILDQLSPQSQTNRTIDFNSLNDSQFASTSIQEELVEEWKKLE